MTLTQDPFAAVRPKVSTKQAPETPSDDPFKDVRAPGFQSNKPLTFGQEVGTGVAKGAIDVASLPALIAHPFESGFGTPDENNRTVLARQKALNNQTEILSKVKKGEPLSLSDVLSLSGDDDTTRGVGGGTSSDNLAKLEQEIPEGGLAQDVARRLTRSAPAAFLGAAEIGRNIAAETGGLLGKYAAKGIDAPKNIQEYADIGAGIITSFLAGGGVNAFSNRLFRATEASIPQGAQVATHALEFELGILRRRLHYGAMSPAKEAALASVDELAAKAANGTMSPNELIDYYRNGNAIMAQRIYKAGGADRGSQYLFEYQQAVRNALELYGHQNPAFLQLFRTSNLAYQGIQQSRRFSRYIRSVASEKGIGSGVMALFGADLAKKTAGEVPNILPRTFLIAGLGAGALQLGEAGYRFAFNPVLRQHYLDVILAATRQNGAKTAAALRQLETDFEKMKKENKLKASQ